MKDMAAMQPGMSFYGDMPDSYSMTVNVDQPVVAKIAAEAKNALDTQITPMTARIAELNGKIEAVDKEIKDGKPTAEQDAQKKEFMTEVEDNRRDVTKIISDYASTQPLVRQLIDLALLGNGLLRGADLSRFIDRSVSLL